MKHLVGWLPGFALLHKDGEKKCGVWSKTMVNF